MALICAILCTTEGACFLCHTDSQGTQHLAGEASSEGGGGGKLLSPERRRCAVEHAREQHRLSERHACRLLGQWRGTQRHITIQRDDEDALTRAIVELASQYGRYGYRRITAVLQRAGWKVGRDRVQRIWQREGKKAKWQRLFLCHNLALATWWAGYLMLQSA